MQDNLNILVNGRQPPTIAGNLTNTTTKNKWSQQLSNYLNGAQLDYLLSQCEQKD